MATVPPTVKPGATSWEECLITVRRYTVLFLQESQEL
jgi:hypothetical protein